MHINHNSSTALVKQNENDGISNTRLLLEYLWKKNNCQLFHVHFRVT